MFKFHYCLLLFFRYKWSFINTPDALNLKQRDHFVPYLLKINTLLKSKVKKLKNFVLKVKLKYLGSSSSTISIINISN